MSLRDESVDINLRGGVDRKTDRRLVIPSKLTEAYDVEFEDSNTVVTRAGLATRALVGGFTTAVRMFEHASVPTIEYLDGTTQRAPASGTGFGVYGAAALSYEASTFARVGVHTRRVQSLVPKPTAPAAGIPLYDRNFDVAVGVSNYCIAWEEPGYTGRMGVRYSVRALDTDVEIQSGFFSGAGAATDIYVKPRVIYDSVNARFSVWTAHFTSAAPTTYLVEASRLPEAGGSVTGPVTVLTLPGGATVEGAIGREALYDVAFHAAQQTYGCVARDCDGGGVGTVYMVATDLAFAAFVGPTNGAPAVRPVSLTAHVSFDAGILLVHAIFGASTSIKGYRLPSNTGVQSAEVIITTVGGTLFGRCVVTDLVAGTSLLIAADNFTATTAIFATTYYLSCTTAHASASRTAIGTNCFLSGRIFTMRGRRYVPVTFTSAQYQSVTLVLDLDCASRNFGVTTTAQPLFVARLDWGETANPSPLASDSAHRVPGCTEALMPYLKFEANTRLAGVTNVTPASIAFAKFAPREQLGDAKWNGDTLLAGALPMVTDGVKLVEEGFHWNPEVVGTVTNGQVVIPPVATGAGIYDFPGIGTYVVAFTESWQDAQGNWHESGYSLLCSVTTTLNNLGINPTIIRPPSLKRDQALLVAGYRTGLTMYRTKMTSTDTTLYLAHSGELAQGSGYINDTDIGFGEVLYTEGGVLGNTPAPSCRHICVFDKRLVLSGCGDGSRIYWSKQESPGFASEFVSDESAFQETVPADYGRVVASVEMNGKLVVLGEKKIGVKFGTGPNSSGTDGSYSAVESVAKDIGALWIAPKSVILAAEGVWFQSAFGLRLFTGVQVARGEGGFQVGAEFGTLVSKTVAMISLAGGTTQQTRFFAAELAFVWDQVWGQFTVFSRHQTVDACLINGVYFFVQNNGTTPRLQYRDPSSNVDAGESAVVQGLIQIAPIQLAGVQGFQRVRRMVLLGKTTSGATPTMTIQVGYDGEDVSVTPEVSGLVATESASGVIQFQHQFFRQKCQSLLLRLTFHDATQLNRIRLTDLALAIGVKYGTSKTPESK